MRYTLIPHTADIGIRLSNKTLKGLFKTGAYALFDILSEIKRTEIKFQKEISVNAVNIEELLNEFLSKLLREFTVEGNLINKTEIIYVEPNYLSAVISGEPFDPQKHFIKIEIKAVTFNDLYVKKTKIGYEAQVIFDV